MKLLHISDTHIHGDIENEENVRVKKMLDYITHAYKDHKIIVTGDITDDGSEAQYIVAEKYFTPVYDGGNLFICPGNHDYGAAGNFYSLERAKRFDVLCNRFRQGGTFVGDNTPVVNCIDNVMIITLNSNLETDSPFDFACGEIGMSQLSSLNTILHTTPSSITKILTFHHHPFLMNDPFMELKDASGLARVIYSRVDVVLFGHKHVMNEYRDRWGIPIMLAADKAHTSGWAKEITIESGTIKVQLVQVF
jgi:3',5'-cyclic AMP phosphodiesterase CpdA